MVTVVTRRAEPMPRYLTWLNGKPGRRSLNGQGVASAAHNACASLSPATSETWGSGQKAMSKDLRRPMHRLWEHSAVQSYGAQYYC